MNFTSPLFLFAFLPLTLAAYLMAGDKGRPWVFTTASLLFCLWAGPLMFPVILISTLVNFSLGRILQTRRETKTPTTKILIAGVFFNIALMLGFKFLVAYGPGWITSLRENVSAVSFSKLEPYLLKSIALPVGISFYSFSAIAYLLDISAGRASAEESLWRFAEFMTAFPKVVAGPITRYRQVSGNLGARSFDLTLAGEGVRRFILGLAKKAVIADRLSLMVDHGVFDQVLPNLSASNAWLVLICYTLQIYFDFSGYSDMAIGLGMIFGIRVPENFNYPYSAKSIAEFWRRWHMSLSGWFREIVFFPLERKRAAGLKWLNTYTNTLIVFFLTGLWHGVTVNFLIWGLLHGLAICAENSGFGKWLKKSPEILQRIWTLLIVMVAWVFFRSNSPAFALGFLQNLVGIRTSTSPTPYSVLYPPTASIWLTLAMGLFFSFPVVGFLQKHLPWTTDERIKTVLSLTLLAVSLIAIAGSTFQPYIYGNF
ncbi:MAG: MBOAT family protein [Chloroflexi bacterium]|nr:MBOAT family protein [Chloroflexota bacterium]BCY16330.1 alginate regulatory protein [Leptolinea sp. HRD-7]